MIENKTTMIGFRATPSERKTIEREAKKLNLRISDYIRFLVLQQPYKSKENSDA